MAPSANSKINKFKKKEHDLTSGKLLMKLSVLSLRLLYLLNVIPGFELLQQQHCLLGLLVALNFVFNHQWDLRDFLNAVP